MSDRGEERTSAGWGCKSGIHCTVHWPAGVCTEMLTGTEIPLKLKSHESATPSFWFYSEWARTSGCVGPLLCRTWEESWVHKSVGCCMFTAHTCNPRPGVCFRAFVFLFSAVVLFFHNKLFVALCFCMLNILGSTHLCSPDPRLLEHNSQM